jgi:hypothetical protein
MLTIALSGDVGRSLLIVNTKLLADVVVMLGATLFVVVEGDMLARNMLEPIIQPATGAAPEPHNKVRFDAVALADIETVYDVSPATRSLA